MWMQISELAFVLHLQFSGADAYSDFVLRRRKLSLREGKQCPQDMAKRGEAGFWSYPLLLSKSQALSFEIDIDKGLFLNVAVSLASDPTPEHLARPV